MSGYIMAIDQGTTGSRTYLFNENGDVVSSAYKEFPQIYPKPGWVEHDAEAIWKTVEETMIAACMQKDIELDEIVAIGITNQRETTVLWDKKTGKPVHNAIVWQCRRTADTCDALKGRGLEKLFREKTGLVVDAYFSGTKVKWILENIPEAGKKAQAGDLMFGTIDTWLMYKLSGGNVHATDYTNASRTLMYNIAEKKWDGEILEILDIPESILPEVKDSAALYGHTSIKLPLSREIPITGVAGDQQAALFGQGCFTPGMAKNTYGTGCFLLSITEDLVYSDNGLVTTLACNAVGKPVYCLEGSVFIAGAAVQWLRDELKIIDNAAEIETLAAGVEDNHGVYMVPAFVGLGAPYWDMHARGGILGLTRGSGRAHVARAVLESIAYQTRDLVEIINQESGVPLEVLRVDGGASNNDLLMQFQADILGIQVDRPKMVETTAAGAAMLAGLGSGFWKSTEDLKEACKVDEIYTPKMAADERERLYDGWKEAVRRVSSGT